MPNTIEEMLISQGSDPTKSSRFFKTSPGSYSEHDKFLGISNITLRALVKNLKHLKVEEITELLNSPYNEVRLLALFILIEQYKKAKPNDRNTIFNFYLQHINQINNWNLVDASAHLILGWHLHDSSPEQQSKTLDSLASSNNLWHRRIAIVSTLFFIRSGQFHHTLSLSKRFLLETEDLMHKACGWMLREVGKKELSPLLNFLDTHSHTMPRTMLRYAIERLSNETRSSYLQVKKVKVRSIA